MRQTKWWMALPMALSGVSARAESLWDGRWFLVPGQSRLAAHSFTLEKLGTGMWQYDSGDAIYILDPSGKAFPEPLQIGAT